MSLNTSVPELIEALLGCELVWKSEDDSQFVAYNGSETFRIFRLGHVHAPEYCLWGWEETDCWTCGDTDLLKQRDVGLYVKAHMEMLEER